MDEGDVDPRGRTLTEDTDDGSQVGFDSDGLPTAGVALLDGDGDRYELGLEHGRGGLGRVLNAYDRTLGRSSVVKELLSESPRHQRRFEREALITASLQHPSIVPVHDAGHREDGTMYYAMKKVEGRPLSQVIAATTSLSERLALVPSVVAVAEAIAYAHSKNIIHRDLKPSNVMIGDYGETVVIDWGLAKSLSDPEDDPSSWESADRGSGLTVAGQVVGTPAYMSPEQASSKAVDARADVYSLGALLYHLLAGRTPHQGTTPEEILANVLRHEPAPIRQEVPSLPEDLAGIVEKAMSTSLEQRYAHAGEMAAALERYQTRQSVGSQLEASMRSVTLETHSLWRELFTGLDGPSAPAERLSITAWFQLLVVLPLIYLPTAVGSAPLWRETRIAWVIWFTGAGIVVLISVGALLILRRGQRYVQTAWYLIAIGVVCHVVCNLTSSYAIGIVSGPGAFYLVLIVAISRVVLDYRLSFIAVATSLAGFLGLLLLEISDVVAVHPAFPEAKMPWYELGVSPWTLGVSSLAGLVLMFALANYAMNQSLKLHRYVRESVLRKYLPPELVERAARGDLSDSPA